MLAPYEWIKDYAEVTSDPQMLAERMVMIGDGVEGIETVGADIRNVVVGRIEKIDKHPDADRLVVCRIDVGADEPVQIVTGATNVFEGAYVPVALAPAQLPGGSIKKSKLRGVVSQGMLCSGEELQVTEAEVPGAGVDGILILQGEPAPGTDVSELLGLKGAVIDFEVGANRPDCLSMLGIAREAAAADRVRFSYPAFDYEEEGSPISDFVNVDVEAPDLCTRYVAGAVEDVHIEPSPAWMQKWLRQAGIRPINNIVDITNFVMLETGQPMHAFDADKIRGSHIVVRRARDGEQMTTLDGTDRTYNDSMLLICDAEGPIGIAGVMGGLDSEITENTRRVVFEAAKFGYGNIRQTSRALGLATESSMRFSKGVDAQMSMMAMRRALHLVQELGAGKVATGMIDVLNEDLASRIIKTTGMRINAILGTSISTREMQQLLERVHIRTGLIGDELICTVPHFRSDISGLHDLAEEVARMYGYDRIPETEAQVNLHIGGVPEEEQRADTIRDYLIHHGFYECLTYSFAGEQDYAKIGAEMPPSVRIRNPLGDDSAYLRRRLLPKMLEVAAMNLSRGNSDLRLFEIARLFVPKEGEKLPEEQQALVVAMSGDGADFLTLKGLVENIVHLAGGRRLRVRAGRADAMSPAASAVLYAGDREIGSMGEISAAVARNYDISQKVFAAEINLDALFSLDRPRVRYEEIARFPAARRDLAVVVGRDAGAGDLLETIREVGGRELEGASLLSVYEGPGVEDGSKSVAFSLSFRSPKGTMQDSDIAKRMDRILKRLGEEHGAKLR
ncbi:MAG: phenylalanine--tRNA ligase subunit beta [Clostridia bacterium]|nr:phenylalanine--tRNA ligase subunit beta [Clostridia bacterium]